VIIRLIIGAAYGAAPVSGRVLPLTEW